MNANLPSSLFGKLQRWKNYAQRSSNYLQVVQIVLLIYIAFRDKIGQSFIVIGFLTTTVVVAGLFIIGFLDNKLGFLESDVTYHESKNPYNKEIIESLKKIERSVLK